MFNRLSKPEYACYIALAAASRSEDNSTQCGAAVFDINWRTLGTGVNGLLPGHKIPTWFNEEDRRAEKSDYILHAESQVFTNIKGNPYYLGLTISCCYRCCNIVVSSGVKSVFYIKEYHRENKFKQIFDFHGIKYEQLSQKSVDNIRQMMEYQMNKNL